jgi:hypothetical protein
VMHDTSYDTPIVGSLRRVRLQIRALFSKERTEY